MINNLVFQIFEKLKSDLLAQHFAKRKKLINWPYERQESILEL